MITTTLFALMLTVSLETVATATEDCRIPRSGWALKPVKHGDIGELYWATQDYSERWITVKPIVTGVKDQRAPTPEILLVFSVCFPGKNLEPPLPTVQIRTQINRDFIPAFVPDPKLEIFVNRQPFSELTKLFPHWVSYPNGCVASESCAHDAVIVEGPVSLLREIAGARIVEGEVSGTRFEIAPPQLEQLGRFLRLIGG